MNKRYLWNGDVWYFSPEKAPASAVLYEEYLAKQAEAKNKARRTTNKSRTTRTKGRRQND